MPSAQRRAAFERFFTALARARSRSLAMEYVGTIRSLPPPPLPGEPPGATRYYVNAIPRGAPGPRLVELGGRAEAALRAAERWVETGEGPAPAAAAPRRKTAS